MLADHIVPKWAYRLPQRLLLSRLIAPSRMNLTNLHLSTFRMRKQIELEFVIISSVVIN